MDGLRKNRKMSDGIRSPKKIRKKPSTVARPFSDTSETNQPIVKKRKRSQKKNLKREDNILFKDVDDAPIFSQEKRKILIRKKSFLKRLISFFKNNRKLVKLFLLSICYCFILFLVFNSFEKTTIELKPRQENIDDITSVQTYLEPKYNQLGFDIISISDTREKIVQATKKISVEEKASGTITVFNNYSREPQRLSPETRFTSVSGKVFKLGKEGAIIPGKTSDSPGSVEITVYADNPGPDYNIDVTDFTIPGFKEAGLTEKFDNIYGLSLNSFTGGFKGERSVVGEQEQEIAIKDLETEMKESLIKRLESEKTDKVILVNNSVQILFREPVIESENNNTSNISQKAQIFALLVEKEQLEKYLKNKYLHNTYSKDIYFRDFNDIIFDYKGGEIDFKNLKKVNLEMNSKGTFVWNIDTQLVAESLAGLRKQDTLIILREFDEIAKANIQIQPFWRNTVSDDIEDIYSIVSQ